MGRRHRAGRQKKKVFVQSIGQKQAAYRKLKADKRKTPVTDENVRGAWDHKKTVQENMDDMGLVYNINDLNKKAPRKKRPANDVDMEANGDVGTSASQVVAKMEVEAARTRTRAYHVGGPHMDFCVAMMERYGEDYDAMVKDPLNYFQDTAAQIKRKLTVFKKTPQYKGYMEAKQRLVI